MPDQMWGSDPTTTLTGEGQAAIFIAVDHCLALRRDHRSPYVSDAFQAEIAFLGIASSPAFMDQYNRT